MGGVCPAGLRKEGGLECARNSDGKGNVPAGRELPAGNGLYKLLQGRKPQPRVKPREAPGRALSSSWAGPAV
ncbi:hypothetical protein NDU88_003051 [Pleurodeles waltl]|uniref:Uncharacterized protein n=1 Tax=Pleurodeles waltl TaxID=8319 RepID=A0AAV7NIT0_PLEWA|nr:hypothetical protein NDU88_003051 [Pleurodeles waltl]